MTAAPPCIRCFFFNDTATTEIYTLSLHDALPICGVRAPPEQPAAGQRFHPVLDQHYPAAPRGDRKSTRLNSSHSQISYAVFCLKKKIRECNENRISVTGLDSGHIRGGLRARHTRA